MAQPLLCSRLGVYSFVCPRCSASLRNNMSVSQKRGNAAAPIRFFNSGSESLHDATPPTRRHDAASVLLYPRSTGSTTRPTSATSYALSAAQSRITPRSHYSSSSTADGPSSSSSTGQSERPEPPDYLDEKEKAIFDRLNEALEPIALQVGTIHLRPNPSFHGMELGSRIEA